MPLARRHLQWALREERGWRRALLTSPPSFFPPPPRRGEEVEVRRYARILGCVLTRLNHPQVVEDEEDAASEQPFWARKLFLMVNRRLWVANPGIHLPQ